MWYLRYHARKFFRSFMKPIPVDKARIWYRRTRYLYVMSGFSAFALSMWIYYQHKEEIDKIPYFDKSPMHKVMRQKGDPGEVIIASVGWNRPMKIERYQNEDYIKEYEEKQRNHEMQKPNQNIV